MLLNLLLIRHAKSSWENLNLSDFDRPLNKRGKHNAPLMGKRINGYEMQIDTIISSPARRAKETAKIIAKEVGFFEKNINYEIGLYHASLDIFIKVLSDQKKENLMMVGHNPGIQEFSYWLCSEPRINFPTCGAILISFNLQEWSELNKYCGTIRSFEYPKMFYEENI